MYVGLDVSKNEIVCVGKDMDGNILYEDKFGVSQDELNRMVGSIGSDSTFAVEASTKGIFVYDCLHSMNINIKVANPIKMRLIAESGKKTDREDASIIADYLRTNMLPLCYMPNKEDREIRDMVRHRKNMVNTRTVIKNKMRAILAREGIDLPYSDILGNKSLSELQNIEIGNVQKDALNKLGRVAEVLNDEIDDYDKKISERFEDSKEAQLLVTVPGIGKYSAVHIMSAIGDIHRFPSDEELASYAGLTPKVFQSGSTRIDKGIRHGDKLLNWVLIQDAHAAVMRKGKLRKYYLKQKRKKGHQKAIVSTARKMVEIIYCMLTRGEVYKE